MTESSLRDHLVRLPHFTDYFGFIALAETFNICFSLVNTHLFFFFYSSISKRHVVAIFERYLNKETIRIITEQSKLFRKTFSLWNHKI